LSGDSYFKARLKSIRIALDGIRMVLQSQQNARIHAVITLLVLLAAGLLDISRLEWVLLLLVIGLVWTAEIFNTAIEELVDLVSPEHNLTAKTVKDLSAGAVLASAIVSILVGLLVFGPRIWAWVSGWGH
jgi:diacylglycerol kinase